MATFTNPSKDNSTVVNISKTTATFAGISVHTDTITNPPYTGATETWNQDNDTWNNSNGTWDDPNKSVFVNPSSDVSTISNPTRH